MKNSVVGILVAIIVINLVGCIQEPELMSNQVIPESNDLIINELRIGDVSEESEIVFLENSPQKLYAVSKVGDQYSLNSFGENFIKEWERPIEFTPTRLNVFTTTTKGPELIFLYGALGSRSQFLILTEDGGLLGATDQGFLELSMIKSCLIQEGKNFYIVARSVNSESVILKATYDEISGRLEGEKVIFSSDSLKFDHLIKGPSANNFLLSARNEDNEISIMSIDNLGDTVSLKWSTVLAEDIRTEVNIGQNLIMNDMEQLMVAIQSEDPNDLEVVQVFGLDARNGDEIWPSKTQFSINSSIKISAVFVKGQEFFLLGSSDYLEQKVNDSRLIQLIGNAWVQKINSAGEFGQEYKFGDVAYYSSFNAGIMLSSGEMVLAGLTNAYYDTGSIRDGLLYSNKFGGRGWMLSFNLPE